MSGAPGTAKRNPPLREIRYLDETVRGVYAKNDLPKGHKIKDTDLFLAIPLLKGQISCRELMAGEVLLRDIKKDQPIFIDNIDSPYAYNETLKNYIYERGVDPKPPKIIEEKVGVKKIKNRRNNKRRPRN